MIYNKNLSQGGPGGPRGGPSNSNANVSNVPLKNPSAKRLTWYYYCRHSCQNNDRPWLHIGSTEIQQVACEGVTDSLGGWMYSRLKTLKDTSDSDKSSLFSDMSVLDMTLRDFATIGPIVLP